MPCECVLLSECLITQPVEGAQVVALQLWRSLRPDAVLSRKGLPSERSWLPVLGRGPVHLRAYRELRRLRPRTLIVLPDGGFHLVLVVRLILLRLVVPRADVRLVLLQLSRHPTRMAMLPIRHRLVAVVGNVADRDLLVSVGVRTELLEIEAPAERVSRSTPEEARASLGISVQMPVFLHVGHSTPGRNLMALAPLADAGLLVVVLSPYTPYSEENVPTGPRIRIVHHRVEVGRYYRAADVYVFPAFERNSAIGVPVSILEALANGVPVVARRSFLTERWAEDHRVTLVESDDQLVSAAIDLVREKGQWGVTTDEATLT